MMADPQGAAGAIAPRAIVNALTIDVEETHQGGVMEELGRPLRTVAKSA